MQIFIHKRYEIVDTFFKFSPEHKNYKPTKHQKQSFRTKSKNKASKVLLMHYPVSFVEM